MKSTKSVVLGLVMVTVASAFPSCTNTTKVVEVNRYVRPAPRRTVVVTQPARTQSPSEFRVTNQYDNDR